MRLTPLLAIPMALMLAACVPQSPGPSQPGARPPAGIPLFGPGFRGPGDQCRRAGESAVTNQFLSDSATLVACPPGTDPRLFSFETGGREVGRHGGWILFSVPHR